MHYWYLPRFCNVLHLSDPIFFPSHPISPTPTLIPSSPYLALPFFFIRAGYANVKLAVAQVQEENLKVKQQVAEESKLLLKKVATPLCYFIN